MDIVSSKLVALARMDGEIAYPSASAAPYHPSEKFPEFPGVPVATVENPIFAMVRNVLRTMKLDEAHFDTPEWNPLGDLVKPGSKIVVKPNWVFHRNLGVGGMDCMITHPSVLRAVLEYVFLAKPAQVILGDAPLQGCDFEKMLEHGDATSVIREFTERGLPLAVKDFRRTVMREDEHGVKHVTEELKPESDYILVDLGADSLLEPISKDWKRFRVTVYDPRKMWKHHRPGRHCYLVAKDILEANLVVNVPKLKVHKKAGITCCLKNLVGINGNKEYLPHHRKGGADAHGHTGDNYEHAHWKLTLSENLLDFANGHLRPFPKTYRLFERIAWRLMVKRKNVDATAQIEGSWHGNDTVWRTCLDLNRVLLYADATGNFHDVPQRQEISIVDAIITGQGEGPLAPDPLHTGVVFAAHNPAVGDYFGARILSFDPEKIPLLQHIDAATRWPICTEKPVSPSFSPSFPPARPPIGWVNHIESQKQTL